MKKQLLLTFLFTGVSLFAQVKDEWKINVGTMLVTNFETEMQLTPRNLPISAKINTKDQLNMKNDTNVFRIDGYYRFTDKHSIDFSYFSVKSSGYTSSNKDIEFNDKFISAGASITSKFDMDVYKVNYGYSFYHSDEVELALTAGLHITTISLGLEATGTIDGVAAESTASSAGITVPLPVFGFKGEYTIIDKTLFINYKTEYFFLEYDTFRGNLHSSSISLEYRFLENIGAGIGYNNNLIYLQVDDGDKKLEVQNALSGAMLYLTYIY